MARTALVVNRMTRFSTTDTNANTTPADVANGNVFVNDGATFLRLRNTDAVQHTVTVQIPANVDGTQTVTQRTYLVAANDNVVAGIFPTQYYSGQLLVNADSALVRLSAFSVAGP